MPTRTHLAALAALSLAVSLNVSSSRQPCAAAVPGLSTEALLQRASIARRLAGTERVELDRDGCVAIAVRTPGTARLLGLVLRGVEVPAHVVRYRVDASAIPAAATPRD